MGEFKNTFYEYTSEVFRRQNRNENPYSFNQERIVIYTRLTLSLLKLVNVREKRRNSDAILFKELVSNSHAITSARNLLLHECIRV